MEYPEKLILASASPRRRQLCEEAGYTVDIRVPQVIEIHDEDDPERTVRANAEIKYASVAQDHPGRIVIAADTVLEFEGRCIGKPQDLEDARRIWRELSDRRHRVLTALATGRGGEAPVVDVVASGVSFRELSDEDMSRYLSEVNPLDKAGGYNIDESAEPGLVKEYDGSYSNIMGLPMESLRLRLQALTGTTRSSL